MPAQGGRRGNTQNEVDLVGATPGEDLRGVPVGPDPTKEAAEESTDVRPLWALGGPQHGGGDATLAIEATDGLEPVVVIVGIERPQLLAAVDGVERVIDVKHDPLGH